MKTNLLKYALLALPLSLLATGCATEEEPDASLPSRSSIEVRFELPAADIDLSKTRAGRSSDDAVGTVTGYRFEEGLLREIATGAESSADGHRQLGVGPLPVIDGNLVVGNCVSAIRAVGLRTGGYR